MAMGPEPLGLIYFVTVKFAGYTAAAHFLRRRYPDSTVKPLLAGAIRTAIGLAAGVGTALTAGRTGIGVPSVAFYALLFPVRLVEWLIILWLFFERRPMQWPRALKWASLGFVWSGLLDIPALLSLFLLPGGVWVC